MKGWLYSLFSILKEARQIARSSEVQTMYIPRSDEESDEDGDEDEENEEEVREENDPPPTVIVDETRIPKGEAYE